jgi:DHA2 family multidrug resistance protein
VAFLSLNTLALSTISPEHRPQCVPLFYLIINLGSGVGVAGAVTYWANHAQSTWALLTEHVSPYNPVLHGSNVPGGWDVGTASGISAINQELIRQAGMIGYNDTFAIVMVGAVVAAALGALFRRKVIRKA